MRVELHRQEMFFNCQVIQYKSLWRPAHIQMLGVHNSKDDCDCRQKLHRNMYKLDLSLHLIQSGLCKYNIKQSTILEKMVTYVPSSQQFEIMPSPNQISYPLLFCSKSQ
jgi:hypothetical protein